MFGVLIKESGYQLIMEAIQILTKNCYLCPTKKNHHL